jgi:hypothetical protein
MAGHAWQRSSVELGGPDRHTCRATGSHSPPRDAIYAMFA